ncbi:P-loop containing nucleoside triphosphate hydrolase protein [Jimgerdemannia flammicorona]|uniref:P-loop containing nucleoside triphosphate hydrolase protein n=1 Tax=Jimgerdemannia flammicorona TaxID=994334 RepID=A0A433Q5S8_9FUNG|nr:P-loop containing nucleoside triphosphate hydrolase protein [Jimgerdemannia flammicorona]
MPGSYIILKNPRFVVRLDIFEELDHAIQDNENKGPKLIALSGLGGMGKSQIALEFCYRNQDYYQYIFWMEADTDAALQSSFKTAAEKLDPPIFAENPADIVRRMLEWFEKNSGWLLVFDNADDYTLNSTSNGRLQRDYFPRSGRGVILMTTRLNYGTGQKKSVVDLNEIQMDDSTALKLLLRENVDDGNALEIVKLLGYLPLALDLTGAFMEIEKCTPTEFLRKYENKSEAYLNPANYVQERMGKDGGKTVFTVWEVSFDRIKNKDPLAASLIQSIAFLYPDNIPLALFENHAQTIFVDKTISSIFKRAAKRAAQLMADYSVGRQTTPKDSNSNVQTTIGAAQMLADYSLVRRTTRKDSEQDDPGKDTLSIHRLVQAAILSKIKLPEKKEMSKRLLSALFHEMKPKNERSVEARPAQLLEGAHVSAPTDRRLSYKSTFVRRC